MTHNGVLSLWRHQDDAKSLDIFCVLCFVLRYTARTYFLSCTSSHKVSFMTFRLFEEHCSISSADWIMCVCILGNIHIKLGLYPYADIQFDS